MEAEATLTTVITGYTVVVQVGPEEYKRLVEELKQAARGTELSALGIAVANSITTSRQWAAQRLETDE